MRNLQRLYIAIKDVKHVFSLVRKSNTKTSCICLCSDVDRTVMKGARYYSPNTDSIVEILNKRGIKTTSIALPYSRLTNSKAFNEPININTSFLFFKILDKLFRQKDYFEVLFWSVLIKKFKPEVIFAIQPSYSLCVACKKLNVISVDVQHGWIPSEELENEMYYTKNYWVRDYVLLTPDYYIVWNNQSKINITKLLNLSGKNVLDIGNYWLSKSIVTRAERTPNDLNHPLLYNDKKPKVLITLLGVNDGLTKTITPLIKEVINDTKSRIGWVIRLHPVYSKVEHYKYISNTLQNWFGKNEYEVIWHKPDEFTLPEVLAKSSLHLTYNSSTAIEANIMGVKTGFLDQNHELIMSGMGDIIESNMGEILKLDYNYLINWINSNTQIHKSNNNLHEHTRLMRNYEDTVLSLFRSSGTVN
jgi:hypothetical protein